MSEHEVHIFESDPKRVLSVTVGELQGRLTEREEEQDAS